jgi:hypothetical protein
MVNDVRSLEAERGWGGGGYGPVLRRCSEVGWLSSGRERVGVRRRCGPLEAFCGYARQRLRSAASWLLLQFYPGGGRCCWRRVADVRAEWHGIRVSVTRVAHNDHGCGSGRSALQCVARGKVVPGSMCPAGGGGGRHSYAAIAAAGASMRLLKGLCGMSGQRRRQR